MARVSLKGVLIGSITDIVASNIFQLPLAIYVTVQLTNEPISSEQMNDAVMLALKNDPIYFTAGVIIGGLCSVMGGYIAGIIAKHNEVLNGALASFLCVLSGIYAMVGGGSVYAWWQHIFFIFLSILLSSLGGFIKYRQVSQRELNA